MTFKEAPEGEMAVGLHNKEDPGCLWEDSLSEGEVAWEVKRRGNESGFREGSQ